jgi:hypothetical protein
MRVLAQALLTTLVFGVASRAWAAPVVPAPRAPREAQKPKAREVVLGDEAKLTSVVSLYEAGKYGECAGELARLLAPDQKDRLREREVIENARIYHAACLIGSGKPEAADEPLRAAIRSNMQMRAPDSLVFPPPVIDRFLRVRQSLYEEIKKAEDQRVEQARKSAEIQADRERAESARVAAIERLATSETVVVRNRRWIGWVPFGVGQFQNGDEGLGWVFLTGETALAATALTSLGMQSYLEVEANRLKNPDNNAVLRTWNTLLHVSSYTFLGVAAIGIAQAQIAFVPEVPQKRYRPLPPELKRSTARVEVTPSFAAGADEVFLGLSGRF